MRECFRTFRRLCAARPAAAALLAVLAVETEVQGCRAWHSAPPRYACRDCNIILISVDTLRADHVHAYGYDRPTTPAIDALAGDAVLFENAIAQSSWTRAAHMSIFTGLHPRQHGYVALADRGRLDDKVPTLASLLHQNGYATAAFVGGMNVGEEYGFDRGFDLYRSNGRLFRDNFQDAMFWLDGNQQAKFFLFLHGYEAHTPYASDPIDRLAVGADKQTPRKGLRKICRKTGPVARVRPFLDAYDAAIHRADRYVGKILAEIERRGLSGRTVVVLLSDHGEEFLEHGRCFHLSTLYREVLHVPLMIKAPGLAPRRIAGLVSASVTVAPTIMDLVGIAAHSFAATSLLAAALGREVPEEAVISETERGEKGGGLGHLRAITTASRKLIDCLSQRREEYFRLDADPGETRPLPATEAADLERTLDGWARMHPPAATSRRDDDEGGAEGGDRELGATPSPEQEQELRSFGYVE
ncbi:MAG: sulfatase [Deltaproteobacteria bacterium]|nr:sulfatase [Deltaproteobacteria bacterium]